MEVVNTTSTTDPVNMYDYLNNYILNPMVFIIILLIIISYYVFSSSLGNGNGETSETSFGSNIMGIIVIIVLIMFITSIVTIANANVSLNIMNKIGKKLDKDWKDV